LYVKSLNTPVDTNALNARKHVESAKEEQKRGTMENKRKSVVATHLLFATMVIPTFP
jgi:hypothetical protein